MHTYLINTLPLITVIKKVNKTKQLNKYFPTNSKYTKRSLMLSDEKYDQSVKLEGTIP